MVEKISENHLGFALKDERKGQQTGFHRLDIFLKENTEDQLYKVIEVETLTTTLVEKVEALFAQEHAKWGEDDQGFWEKLAEIPPLTCYASCLITLQDKLTNKEYKRFNRSEELMNLLKRESKALEIDDVSSLPTLLKKG